MTGILLWQDKQTITLTIKCGEAVRGREKAIQKEARRPSNLRNESIDTTIHMKLHHSEPITGLSRSILSTQ